MDPTMNEIQKLENQVTQVDRKVSSILQLLKGNEIDKDDNGMIGNQNDHEKRIVGLEKMKDRIIYFLFGLSVFAGWGVIDILEKIFAKP